MTDPDAFLADLLGLAPPGLADDLSDEGLATLWAQAGILEQRLPVSQHGLDLSQLAEFDPADPVWAGVQRAVLDELAPPIVLPWRRTARDTQLPPPGRWRHWLIMAGRGWGKTFVGANWLAERALTDPGDYAVVAKVDLEAGAAFGADVQLVTDDGTTHANVDHSTVTAAMGVGSAHSEHNLQALVHLANTTSIWLEARGDPPPWSARNAKVLAIRVVSAADAEVTG